MSRNDNTPLVPPTTTVTTNARIAVSDYDKIIKALADAQLLEGTVDFTMLVDEPGKPTKYTDLKLGYTRARELADAGKPSYLRGDGWVRFRVVREISAASGGVPGMPAARRVASVAFIPAE